MNPKEINEQLVANYFSILYAMHYSHTTNIVALEEIIHFTITEFSVTYLTYPSYFASISDVAILEQLVLMLRENLTELDNLKAA